LGVALGPAAFLLLFSASVPAQTPATLPEGCDARLAALLESNVPEAEALARQRLAEEPQDPYCLASLGEALLLKGSPFFALEPLSAAKDSLDERDPASARKVDLLLCIALSRTGQWEEAYETCGGDSSQGMGEVPFQGMGEILHPAGGGAQDDVAEQDSSSVSEAMRYYRGVAAFRTGRAHEAVRLLDEGRGPWANEREVFRDLAWGALIGVRPGLKAGVGVGTVYDTNALMAPEDPLSVGLQESDVAAWRSSTWASLAWLPRNFGRYQLSLRAGGFRSRAWATPADSLNTTDATGSAALARYDAGETVHGAWQARYNYRITMLDGGEAALEQDLFAFTESHGLSLSRTFFDAGGRSYTIQYAPSIHRFREIVRNAAIHAVSMGQDLPLGDSLRLGFGQTAYIADSTSAYSRVGFGLGNTGQLAFSPSLGLAWGLTGQYDDYRDSAGYFDAIEARADRLYLARLEAYWSFLPSVTAGVYGAASGRISSIDTLSYDKMEGGLTLNWAVEGGM